MASNDMDNSGQLDNNIFIFKGRFKSNSLSLYGLFLIVFNTHGDVDAHNIIVSTYSSVYDLEPHSNWITYEETIQDLKWKGNINNSMSSSLMDQLNRIISEDVLRNQLYAYLGEYNYDNVDMMLFDAINRIINDKNLLLETGIQEITIEEFQESRGKKFPSTESVSTSDSTLAVEEGAVILSIEPILAPVKGKPVFELKVGDKIMAKITPNTDRANYFIDLLDLRIEGHIKSIPCEVIDIKAKTRDDPIEILTEIGPGIYGKCIEDERQVKLRIYNPSVDSSISRASWESKKKVIRSEKEIRREEPGLSRMTYIIMGLFALIVLIFLLLIYFSL
jgi:hypothetical protein